MKRVKSFLLFWLMALAILIMLVSNANAQGQKGRANFGAAAEPQPLWSEYKGVRLGMTAQESRAKLGEPALKADDQDYYVFSEKETAQIVYDSAHKVITISVDYLDGVGAPDPKSVVGGDLELKPNGSQYRLVRYESRGFWVSYNRSAGTVSMVTITIQKM